MRPPFPIPSPSLSSKRPVETGSIVRWRTVAISMLLLGAALAEGGLVVGWVTTNQPVLVHAIAVVFVGLAGMVSRVPVEAYRTMARAVIVVSIVVIGMLIVALDGLTMLPVFLMWPMLGAAYLLSRAEAIAISVLAAVACAIGLALRDSDPFPTDDFIVLLMVGFVVVAAVRLLAEGVTSTVQALRHRSLTDPLTGLLNRRGFEALLGQHFLRARFDGGLIAAMLLDIDHFKAVNDQFGHAVGDQALLRFTHLLEASCRASDLVARVGGEEFAVVMPGATIEQAVARAEQFCAVLRADRFVEGVTLTTSIGISARKKGAEGWDAMLEAADAAVYEAKRAGRDQVVVAGVRAAAGRSGGPDHAQD